MATTRQDIAGVIAEKYGISRSKADAILIDVFGRIMNLSCAGEEVSLHGFGKFRCKIRAGGERHNPRTGEKIIIAEKRTPKFSPAKGFKDLAAAD